MSTAFNIKQQINNEEEATTSTSRNNEQFLRAKIEPLQEYLFTPNTEQSNSTSTSPDNSQDDEWYTSRSSKIPKVEIKVEPYDVSFPTTSVMKEAGGGITSSYWCVKSEPPEDYLSTSCSQQSNEVSIDDSQDDEYITSESIKLINVVPKVELSGDSSAPASPDGKKAESNEIISNRWLGTKGFHSCIIHICPICRVEYGNTWSWRRHLGNVHQLLTRENLNLEYISSNRAKCNECGHIIKSKKFTAFLEHALTHLPGRNYFKCKFCAWCTFTSTSIASHLLKDHAAEVKKEIGSMQCPYCLKEFANTTKMRTHMQNAHKKLIDEKIVYICPCCDKKFSNNVMFRQHLVAKHTQHSADVYNFKQIPTPDENDESKTSYQCILCSITLRDDYRIFNKMQMHALIHSEKHRFSCKYCGEMFFQLLSIQSHICDELREAQLLNTVPPAGSSKAAIMRKKGDKGYKTTKMTMKNIQHVCPMCGRGFSCESKCARHRNTHHNLNKPKVLNFTQTEEKPIYECTVCKEFTTVLDLDTMLTHAALHMSHQRFKCKICKSSFDTKSQALEHECSNAAGSTGKMSVPLILSPMIFYECFSCRREFEDIQRWQQHLDDVHGFNDLSVLRLKRGRGNVLKCLDCGKIVGDTATSRRAHRLAHLSFKHYKCTRCGEALGTEKEAHSHDVQCTNYYEGPGSDMEENDTSEDASSNHIDSKDTLGDDSTLDIPVAEVQKYTKMICTLCNDMEFNTKMQLMSHLRNVHECFKDSYTFNKDGSCTCNVCNKYFTEFNRSFMTKHHLIHMERPCFICKQCDVKVNTFVSMHSHILKTHISDIVSQGLVEKDAKGDPLQVTSTDLFRTSRVRMAVCNEKSVVFNEFKKYISYACAECNESLPTQELWHLHMNSNHNFLDEKHINIKLTTEGVKRCLECNVKISGGILHEQRHKFTHMPYSSFVCTMCLHRSNTLGVLIQHLRRRHFTAGKFKCPACPQVLTTDVARHEHVRNEHDVVEMPKTTCHICLRNYSQVRKLKTHMDVHNPERQVFNCDGCSRTYFSFNEMQRHKRRAHPQKLENEVEEGKGVQISKIATRSNSDALTAWQDECANDSRAQHNAVDMGNDEDELISVIKIEEPEYEESPLHNETN